jgi:cohesin loading factor subunit SCC2
VESILEFTKKLQRRLIFPRYDSMYQEVSGVARVEFENSSDKDDESHSDEKSSSANDDKPGGARAKPRGRRTKTATTSTSEPEPAVDSHLVHMNFKLADIYKTMAAVLASGVTYPDTVALSASLCCLESFFVHNIVNLQLSCASVLACVCQKYSSLRHSILEDLVVSWPKILRDSEVSRDARVSAQSGKRQETINVYSLLVMEIVHACAGGSALSTWSHRTALTTDKEGVEGAPAPTPSNANDTNGSGQQGSFLSAKHAAKSVVEQLFSRCVSGTVSDSNYRIIMQSFIEDLLKCMFHPEWPCADLILQLCTERLVMLLRGQPEAAQPVAKLSQLKEIAILVLGNIIGEVKRESLANEASAALFSSYKGSSVRAESIDDPDAKCPVCDRPWEQQFMICCDGCQRWFHGDCVDLAESDAPDSWKCDGCLVVEQVEYIRTQAAADNAVTAPARKNKKQKAIAADSVVVPPPDREAVEQLVAKQFVWIHLTARAVTYPSAADALQYLFSQWITEAHHQKDLALFQSWARQTHFRTNHLSLRSLTMLFSRLTLRHAIWSDLMRPLSFILFSLQDKDAKLRRSCLRSLQKILAVCPEWMAEPKVFNSIRARFLDNAISVREVALDIVGDFMLTNTELAKQYYVPVVSSINDAGISVRKRVVRIMKALLLSPHTKNVISLADICVKLSSRLRDDMSIKTVVLAMFTDMWIKGRLEPDSKEGLDHLNPATFTVQARVDQIIEVVSSILSLAIPGDVSAAMFFCELVRRALGLDTAQQDSKPVSSKKLIGYRDVLQEIAESVFSTALSEPSATVGEKKPMTRKVACFAVVHLLAKADPNLIVPIIEQMAPLLKTRDLSPEWSNCLIHLCATIELVLIHMTSLRDVQPIVAALEDDLIVIAKHFATNVVQVSLRTLCNIVQATNSRTERIEQLYAECYLQLKEDKSLVRGAGLDLKKRICRNIFTLGAVCRYFVWSDCSYQSS